MILSPLYRFPYGTSFSSRAELAVLICGLLVVRKRTFVLEANKPGKRSAFATGVCVFLYILAWEPFTWMSLWIAFGSRSIPHGRMGKVLFKTGQR